MSFDNIQTLENTILKADNKRDQGLDLWSQVYQYQYNNNDIFRNYIQLIKSKNGQNRHFLPVEFFKNNIVKTGDWEEAVIFRSSGTTQRARSNHYIKDLHLYNRIARQIFESHFGRLNNRPIIALLPSYLERPDSSLIYMVQSFIQISGHPECKFIGADLDTCFEILKKLKDESGILIGVSFALMDFAEKYEIDLKSWNIIETGGMKGRRVEMTRFELHDILKNAFKVNTIASEYGMTELCAQSYAMSEGQFKTNPWFEVEIREIDDPFAVCKNGRLGRICISDLSNVHSCSFIATDDLGRMPEAGIFTVEGRVDNSDLRGCNLLFH